MREMPTEVDQLVALDQQLGILVKGPRPFSPQIPAFEGKMVVTPCSRKQVKQEAAQPFEYESQEETRQRPNEPAAQNPHDLFPLDGFASTCGSCPGHCANECLIHRGKEPLADGCQDHERLDPLSGTRHCEIHLDHIKRDGFENTATPG